MPAGRNGPAFIATPNFYTLKVYNNSDLYALFIGHVADRMAGGGAFKGGWVQVEGMTRGDVARMQEKLVARGYDVGGADGLPGFKTRRSIGEYEASAGLPPTCWPSRDVSARLK
jgi:peptidoglycan hydrolase-like protein with peptidoglycan-binding domain